MHYVTERPSECTSIKTRDLARCVLKDLVFIIIIIIIIIMRALQHMTSQKIE